MLEVEQVIRSGGIIGGGGREAQQQRGISYLHRTQLAGLKRLSARATASTTKPAGTRRVYFSFAEYATSAIQHLKRAQIPTAEGLSDGELDRIEATFEFTFPPDLKAILQEGLPVGAGFPNWRRMGKLEQLKTRIELPCAGLLHEVALGRFWWKTWGQRPGDKDHAVEIAAAALQTSPTLIPIFGHCYIPCSPNLAGNPIFFVYQKVVMYCGYDIADFFDRELFLMHACMNPLEAVHETGSLLQKSGDTGESFHYTNLDSLHRISVGSSGTDSSATSSSGASDGVGGETWGRSLDFLAKQSEGFKLETLKRTERRVTHSGRLKDGCASHQQLTGARSFDRTSCLQESDSPQASLTIYSAEEKPLPSEALPKISLLTRPWASRTPRHIEFWSDIANKQKVSVAVAAEATAAGEEEGDGLFSPCIVDDDVTRTPPRLLSNPKQQPSDTINKDQLVPNSSKWLTCYLEEMSLVLRQGGWRDDDISDMMEAQSLPPTTTWNQQIDAQVKISQLISETVGFDF